MLYRVFFLMTFSKIIPWLFMDTWYTILYVPTTLDRVVCWTSFFSIMFVENEV